MNELTGFWAEWVRPSAGLPIVLWSLLIAVAAATGHLVQRYIGMPKVVGYSMVGTVVGLAGFEGAVWPLQGVSLFLLELGVAIVLFEAGGRLPLRWFRHNPMVLVQSVVESTLTYFGVFWMLHWLGVPDPVGNALALMTIVASPAVLTRVVMDTRASGPVTDRALTLATLNTFYALALGYAQAGLIERAPTDVFQRLQPVLVVLGLSFVVGGALALALRSALRVMSPTSENTSILLLALIAAGAAMAAHLGGSAPLAALIGGIMLKQLNPRPWSWPRQLGTAASLLTMLMFVLVSIVAAQADWSLQIATVVLALIGVRFVAKIAGVAIANPGSGASWRQAFWVGCAMSPLSSIALLIASNFVTASPLLGAMITQTALPAILLMEVAGAVLATIAIHAAGESSIPWTPEAFSTTEDTQR
ncbi:cation:proton antiporter [Variovorax sp. J22G21]|uniref:cation:proton antiporter n=1 Tax=Variovorax fucosicus TaxID=3053517 RepID=UPI002576A55D|nr:MULTISPECIES: cation:proton antiporter [unclassified Variovorax]MDM0039681.1 cation:proton antiporter [Variovorax sp. J22R193]MDM0054708.1 cation:proton antiporter [Variovorax sp. J22G47]MDM0064456.1 cation:proton antiporter [Variovorax sp. J22G21]